MLYFTNNYSSIKNNLKHALQTGFWIGAGVLVFIFFFKPFGIEISDFNNYILIISGIGIITFILITLINYFLPRLHIKWIRSGRRNMKILWLLQLAVWVIISVAFTFYLRYVGHVQLSIFMVTKISLLGLIPPIINMFLQEIYFLRNQLEELLQRNNELTKSVENNGNGKNEIIEFASDSRSEKISLGLNELILIKSAENYVEIHYLEDDMIQRKLLRTTLKSIEDQLSLYPFVVRCHRTCLVNTSHVEKFHLTHKGFRLKVTEYEEQVPVSRQYLIGVKTALNIS